ncbi:carotenoid oxygenase family protein [Ectothiorhodospira lacustris]|uniref:carotenoid oxygenase family protein n=1 Tax=Ectothiorhodospira lacustris TaxID=2899127 RepID=UPI001EE8DDC0|nr:carotenoid oxygenase family protein [Ectothiorhodospira lacustris]MCG5509697.1 carotenoid oxygenase family protein [Ectothiorhodospira lacustris]MCG5523070.1 carotenoid oxygenase family protein [Ectothiorhodospira lacustris]
MTAARVGYHLGVTSQGREVDQDALPLRGHLPDWLKGVLLRNGPGLFETGDYHCRHWFDGLAMLQSFTLRGGRVGFRNRHLATRTLEQARHNGRIQGSGFATDTHHSLLKRLRGLVRPVLTDNANVNIAHLAGQVVCLTETPLPMAFDPDTLETRGPLPFTDTTELHLSTAHPMADSHSGDLYGFGIRFGLNSEYLLFRIPAGTRRRRIIARLPVKTPAYMHSFALTRHHLVLSEFPLVVTPLDMLITGRPFIENFRWLPELGTRFQVFDRQRGTHLATCVGEPCFAFHHINAFEDQAGRLQVDLAAYPDADVIRRLYLEPLRRGWTEPACGEAWRFTLDVRRGTATRTVLGERGLELPRIHATRCSGRDYRYVYGTGNHVPGALMDELVKLDVGRGTHLTWSEADGYPGEPVFVPRPGATEEDDGVLLSVVLDAAAGTSHLLILDARTLEERARATLPIPLPFGFHGAFLPDHAG